MGGGSFRTAAKVAGLGVNGGLRGAPRVPRPEKSVITTAARNASTSVADYVSSAAVKDRKPDVFVSSQNSNIMPSASVQRPSWEISDWEFAASVEEMHPMPRIIFGGVSTLDEAKEATSDLKDALETVYFPSSSATGCRSSSTIVQEIVPAYSETKAHVTSEKLMASPSVTNPVFHALAFLRESPEAQIALASLASSKEVFDAVMKNDKVVEFLKNQQTCVHPPATDTFVKGHFADSECHEDQKSLDDGTDQKYSEGTRNVFMDFAQKVKLRVKEMVSNTYVKEHFADNECRDDHKSFDDGTDQKYSKGTRNVFMDFAQKVKLRVKVMVGNFSGFFQNSFVGPAASNSSPDAEGNTFEDRTFGSYFKALAILVIMVVVLKRV